MRLFLCREENNLVIDSTFPPDDYLVMVDKNQPGNGATRHGMGTSLEVQRSLFVGSTIQKSSCMPFAPKGSQPVSTREACLLVYSPLHPACLCGFAARAHLPILPSVMRRAC